MNKSFKSNCDKKNLLENIFVLIEDTPETADNFDSGRGLLCQQVKTFLSKNIALVLEFISGEHEMTKSALEGIGWINWQWCI